MLREKDLNSGIIIYYKKKATLDNKSYNTKSFCHQC